MAKLDVSTIEGFDGMSAEAKVEALMALEVPDAVDMSKYIEKAAFDKTSSELAEAKRNLAANKTGNDAEKAAYVGEIAELKGQIEALTKQAAINDSKAKYMALPGYTEKMAADMADALYGGDMAKVYEIQQKAAQEHEKHIKATALKNMQPPAGGSADSKTEAETIAERIARERAEADKRAKDIMDRYTRR